MGAMKSNLTNNKVTFYTFKITQFGDEFSFELRAHLDLQTVNGVDVFYM